LPARALLFEIEMNDYDFLVASAGAAAGVAAALAGAAAASLAAPEGAVVASEGALAGAAGASLVASGAGAASSAFFWHAASAIEVEATKRNNAVFFI